MRSGTTSRRSGPGQAACAVALGALALARRPRGLRAPDVLGLPGKHDQAHSEFLMYAWTFIAAIVVGGLVALHHDLGGDPLPAPQRRDARASSSTTVPVEVLYTIIPIVIVLMIFGFTVVTENNIDALSSSPAAHVKVTAFQWGWEFQYPSNNIVVLGHTTQDPDLVLPSGQTTQITLVSQDVIHGFYVPEFNFSRYAQPGVTNLFDLTPERIEHAAGLPGSMHPAVRPLPRAHVLPRDDPASCAIPGMARAKHEPELHRQRLRTAAMRNRHVVGNGVIGS